MRATQRIILARLTQDSGRTTTFRSDRASISMLATCQVLSFTMMLRYSFDHSEEADLIESAVSDALSSGARTPDLGGGSKKVSTTEMMDLVINSMNQRIDS